MYPTILTDQNCQNVYKYERSKYGLVALIRIIASLHFGVFQENN